MRFRLLVIPCMWLGAALMVLAQAPATAPQTASGASVGGSAAGEQAAVARTITAVNYRHRGGASEIDFRGTELMPEAKGKAKVESKTGRTEIDAKFEGVQSPNRFGMEYLTYVLWAISPEGRAKNLGEVRLDDGKGELKVTTDLQAFGLILTAEPYFAVTQPSDEVVAENATRPETKGGEEPVRARYELLPRGLYAASNQPIKDVVYGVDKKTPLELMEARNAVRIARNAQADRYASGSFQRSEQLLNQAEDYYRRKQGRTPISTAAREAAQTAEEARVMSLRARQEEQAAAERRALQEREAQAKAQADEDARKRAQAEADTARAAQAKADAERMRAQAEAATQQAQQERQQATAQAQQAEQARLKAELDKEQTRARLLQQLNQVLETRDSARGLIVNMSDVLFDTGKSTLKPGARERLAKVAGIVQTYPDLQLQIEGHTDSVGGDEYNRRLSEERAEAVRGYLVSQGVPAGRVTAAGLGKSAPVATNATAAGRQLNRRVDLVVSGEAINASAQGGGTNPATGSGGGTVGGVVGSSQPGAAPVTPSSIGTPSGDRPNSNSSAPVTEEQTR